MEQAAWRRLAELQEATLRALTQAQEQLLAERAQHAAQIAGMHEEVRLLHTALRSLLPGAGGSDGARRRQVEPPAAADSAAALASTSGIERAPAPKDSPDRIPSPTDSPDGAPAQPPARSSPAPRAARPLHMLSAWQDEFRAAIRLAAGAEDILRIPANQFGEALRREVEYGVDVTAVQGTVGAEPETSGEDQGLGRGL